MKRKLIALLSIVMTTSMVLGACGNKEANEADENSKNSESSTENLKGKEVIKASDSSKIPQVSKDRKDTLVVGMTDPQGLFNPIYDQGIYDGWVDSLVFTPLISNDEKGNPTPFAAEKWEISDDQKTYTFHLKKGIKFTNGEELKAKDVEFTWLALSDPKYDGPRGDSISSLVGYDEYKNGSAKNVSGIKVIDDYTISATFKNVKASGIYNLSFGILPKSVYNFDKGNIQVLKQKFLQPVGSGPYKFVEFKQGQSVSLVRNDDYFKGAPKIKNILMKVTNAQTIMQELQSGNVDIDTISANAKNITMLKEAGFLDLNLYPQASYSFIGLNLRNKKFEDKKVRQALAYGVDKKGFLESYYGEYAFPINTHAAIPSWAYPEDESQLNAYEYNPEKAKELLDEAGWKVNSSTGIREKDGVPLKINWKTFTGSKYTDTLIPIVKEGWKAIGVDVEPELMEFATLQKQITQNRDFDIYNMSWSMSVDPDPSGIFSKSQDLVGGLNTVGWHPDKSEELIKKGLETTKQEDRKKIYNEWQKLINDEVPYIFIGSSKDLVVSSSKVKNLDVSAYRNWTADIEKVELSQ